MERECQKPYAPFCVLLNPMTHDIDGKNSMSMTIQIDGIQNLKFKRMSYFNLLVKKCSTALLRSPVFQLHDLFGRGNSSALSGPGGHDLSYSELSTACTAVEPEVSWWTLFAAVSCGPRDRA